MIFASLALFGFGARYGATNMRAQAVAEQIFTFSQLRISLHSEEHGSAHMPVISAAQYDMLIARGALLRQLWYLGFLSDADQVLNQALTMALNARGADNVIKTFRDAKGDPEKAGGFSASMLDEIIFALNEAKTELIDNAPEADESPVVEEPETAEAAIESE